MKLSIPHRISLPLCIFAGIMVIVCTLLLVRTNDPRVNDAATSYRRGESALAIAQRKQAFNQALDLYKTLEQDYQPRFGNGKLYYNIADTYFQLEEYPWAILYYSRAQALMPRDERIVRNLAITLDKLALPKESTANAFSKVFFFHDYLSLPERLQVFFICSLSALLFGSLYLWMDNRWIKSGMYASLFLVLVMLLSLSYTKYFSSIEAILVKSTDLYRDAGTQYAKVGERPLPGGTRIHVLEAQADGKWYKVVSTNGDLGYVPRETIRVIFN